MWMEFAQSFTPRDNRTWADRRHWVGVTWYGVPLPPGAPVRLYHWKGQPIILSADGLPVGALQAALNPNRRGLVRAITSQQIGRVDLSYLGPDDLWLV